MRGFNDERKSMSKKAIIGAAAAIVAVSGLFLGLSDLRYRFYDTARLDETVSHAMESDDGSIVKAVLRNSNYSSRQEHEPELLMKGAIETGKIGVFEALYSIGIRPLDPDLAAWSRDDLAALAGVYAENNALMKKMLDGLKPDAEEDAKYFSDLDKQGSILNASIKKAPSQELALKLVRYFVSQGRDVNWNSPHIHWATPLGIAAIQGYVDVFEFLKKAGAHINDEALKKSQFDTEVQMKAYVGRCNTDLMSTDEAKKINAGEKITITHCEPIAGYRKIAGSAQ
jgi:hypothetical protein